MVSLYKWLNTLLNTAKLLVFLDKGPVGFKVLWVSVSHFIKIPMYFISPNIPSDWRAWKTSTDAAASRIE